MPQQLPVPYHPQKSDDYCLVACAPMVLHYWGTATDLEQLVRQLGVEPGVGVPAGRIARLVSYGLAPKKKMKGDVDLSLHCLQSFWPRNAKRPFSQIAERLLVSDQV